MAEPRLLTLDVAGGTKLSVPISQACRYMRITECPKGDGTAPAFQGLLYWLADDNYTQSYQTLPGGQIDLGNALGINGSGMSPLIGLPAHDVPAAYAGGTTYAKNDTVTYAGVYYVSLVDANVGNQPDISPTQWQAFTHPSPRAADVPIKLTSATAVATYILVESFS